MPASLNQINYTLGELTKAVSGLTEKIDANERRNEAAIAQANASRANVHKRLDDLSSKTTHLEAQMGDMTARVGAMQNVTDGVQVLSYKAQGAGTAGQWALRIGIALLTGLGWIMAGYTWLTGRPPP